jgi:Flp pilus assembly protein TadD
MFFVLGLAAAQTASWEQLTASGTELHAKGQYAEAEGAFRRALEKAEEAADPRRIARSLNDLAVVLRIRGDVAHAEEMYRRAWSFGKHCRSRRTWLRV